MQTTFMRHFCIFCSLLFFYLAPAQDYVDLAKVAYSEGFNADFEDGSGQTRVSNLDVNLTFPLVIDEKNAIITGADYNRTNLGLAAMMPQTNLNSATLKLGWARTWNERWSTTVVFLPKIASDYKDIDSEDFYFGGYGVFKYQQNENLMYRFGAYASQEAFGLNATPIFGIYYTSPNDLWEVDLSLPIVANINYIVSRNLKLGADYIGLGRSYSLTTNGIKATYVQQNSLEFTTYIEKAFLEQNLLIRLKLGVSTNDYELYAIDESIDFGLAAFRFGDDRTQLNQNINTAPFLRIEAIYRLYIDNTSKE